MEIAPILSAYDVDIVVDFAITRVSCGKLLSSCSHLVSCTAPVRRGKGARSSRLLEREREREIEEERPSRSMESQQNLGKEMAGRGGGETRNWIWFGFHRSREGIISTIEGA